MTTQEKIDLIKALTEVIKVNSGFWGDEELCKDANKRISILLKEI